MMLSVADVWRVSLPGRVGAGLFAVCAASLAAWIAGAAAGDGHWWQGMSLATGICLVPAVFALLYAFRARVEVGSDALVVVKTFSRHRVEWSEIRDATPGYSGIVVLMRDGGRLVAGAVQKANLSVWLNRRTRADELAAVIAQRAQAVGPQ